MDKSVRVNFRINPELRERLLTVCADRDIPEAQALREGIRLWLDREGNRARAQRKGGRMKK